MTSLLIDLQYFPSVEYYLTINKFSDVIFDQYDRYRKMSFRNRCVIAGANGPINLSIPLLGGRDQKLLTREILIKNSEDWRARHFKSIVSAYNRSPFFEHFETSLAELFSRTYTNLFDWNLVCLEWINSQIGYKMKIGVTEKFEYIATAQDTLDLRDWFFPRTISQTISNPLTYRQVFEDRHGFIPNLSILDLLFCAGPAGVRSAVVARIKS